MRKLNLTTALLVGSMIMGSTLLAQITLIDESFDYGLTDGTVVNDGTLSDWGNGFGTASASFSTTDYDGTGGSMIISEGGPFLNMTNANSSNQDVDFAFTLYGNGDNVSGARVMFQTVTTDSSSGFGTNFNYTASTDTFTIWARVGGTHANSISVTGVAEITGSYSYNTGTGLGSLTLTDGVNSASQLDTSYGTLGSDIVFRARGTSATWGVDGVSATAIPEPSAFVLMGVALGATLLFRRRKR